MRSADSVAVIGDVHGCRDQLVQLVDALPRSVQRYVFVGDYVNRGSNSKGVLDFCVNLRERVRSNFVLGNHDAAFLQFLRTRDVDRFLAYGGAATLRSYEQDFSGDFVTRLVEAVPPSHLSFLESLVPYVLIDGLAVTHGPNDPLPTASVDFRVSGHFPTTGNTAVITDRFAAIDTGCGTIEGAPLTCLLWPSLETFQQRP